MEAASPHTAHTQVTPALHNHDRHAGYFELTEELLLQNKDHSKNPGKQGNIHICAILCAIAYRIICVFPTLIRMLFH